jgi:hypothetical protein
MWLRWRVPQTSVTVWVSLQATHIFYLVYTKLNLKKYFFKSLWTMSRYLTKCYILNMIQFECACLAWDVWFWTTSNTVLCLARGGWFWTTTDLISFFQCPVPPVSNTDLWRRIASPASGVTTEMQQTDSRLRVRCVLLISSPLVHEPLVRVPAA